MYTDDERRTNLPIKTFLLSLIMIIIFVLLLMWLLPIQNGSNSGNSNGNNNGNNTENRSTYPSLDVLTNRIFNSNLQEMKSAAIYYFTTDKLPTNVGDTKTLTLQQMLDMNLLLPFTDKNGNSCDTQGSYVTLTKKQDSYEMKVNLKCDNEENYVLVTLGCYSYCTQTICEKKQSIIETVKQTTPSKPSTPTPSKPTPTPGGDEPTPVVTITDPTCSLYVSNGTVGNGGWYISDAVVKFKTIKATTDGASIVSYGMGVTESPNYNGIEQYTINTDGAITIYGYAKDSNGKTTICSINVKRDTTKPSCKLVVLSGTKSGNAYVSNVVVGFASRIDATSGIKYFGLSEFASATYNQVEKYTITKNGTHKVYGYVQDGAGNTAACDLTVVKETTPTPVTSTPSCSLKVTNATLGTNGWYKSDVRIGFASRTSTNGATITAFGLGTSENYNGSTSYTVTSEGNSTVYGYVKDSNGNTAVCSISVKKDSVKPTCSLKVTSAVYNTNGYYTSNVVLGYASRYDATSGIQAFGLGTSENYDGKTSYTVTQVGTTTVYGYVKDKAGNTGVCSITVTRKTPEPTPPTSTPSCTLKVTNGTLGTNGWYKSDVKIGFASRTSTNGATITAFGLGTSENYSGLTSYTVTNDGTSTVYGYVKDSNGKTAKCSITVKKDAVKPSCTLKVTRATYNTNGYYTSDVVIGFATRTDTQSGISAYSVGVSESYDGTGTYTVTKDGTTTVYGYVKDKAGNTGICSLTVTKAKTGKYEYEYKKNIGNQYSAWSDWKTYTYNPSNPPKFGKWALVETEDLGKKTVVDYYKESLGDAIYKYKKVLMGTITEKHCAGYTYYRDTTTTTTTYAVRQDNGWRFVGMVTLTGSPTDTYSVRYEFVGFDWTCTGCELTPREIWNKYVRDVSTTTTTDTVTTSGITVKCTKVEDVKVELYDTVKIFVEYKKIKTPVYKDVYQYRQRTRTLVKEAYTDYKWSKYNDTNLLNNGYTYTGNSRKVA